jgi:hypothetical protein
MGSAIVNALDRGRIERRGCVVGVEDCWGKMAKKKGGGEKGRDSGFW